MQKGNPLPSADSIFLVSYITSGKTHQGIIIALEYASFRFFVSSFFEILVRIFARGNSHHISENQSVSFGRDHFNDYSITVDYLAKSNLSITIPEFFIIESS